MLLLIMICGIIGLPLFSIGLLLFAFNVVPLWIAFVGLVMFLICLPFADIFDEIFKNND